MKNQYGNLQQSSGVTHFEHHADAIVVHFGKQSYRYSHAGAGKEHVEAMKTLAAGGAGLASYIRKNKPKHDD